MAVVVLTILGYNRLETFFLRLSSSEKPPNVSKLVSKNIYIRRLKVPVIFKLLNLTMNSLALDYLALCCPKASQNSSQCIIIHDY